MVWKGNRRKVKQNIICFKNSNPTVSTYTDKEGGTQRCPRDDQTKEVKKLQK